MAQRYSQKEKDAVVEYVKNHNETHGRGGQSAATKKFGINPITIKSWLEKAGVASPGRGGGRKKTTKKKGAKRGRKPAAARAAAKPAAAPSGGGSISASLNRMAEIQDQIASLQSEYDSLKSTI